MVKQEGAPDAWTFVVLDDALRVAADTQLNAPEALVCPTQQHTPPTLEDLEQGRFDAISYRCRTTPIPPADSEEVLLWCPHHDQVPILRANGQQEVLSKEAFDALKHTVGE